MEQYAGIISQADLVYLLDVTDIDLNDPRRFRKVHDVLNFFKGDDAAKSRILKVLAKDRREDKLDAIWTWVQLEADRQAKIASLNPDDFTEDIQEELKQGFLSREKIQELQKQLKDMERAEQSASIEREITSVKESAERGRVDTALRNALEPVKRAEFQQKIEEIATVTQELNNYL